MKLANYRRRNKIGLQEFAEALGYRRQVVWRWENGLVMPSHKSLEDIYTATGGRVTPNDFFFDMQARRKKKRAR